MFRSTRTRSLKWAAVLEAAALVAASLRRRLSRTLVVSTWEGQREASTESTLMTLSTPIVFVPGMPHTCDRGPNPLPLFLGNSLCFWPDYHTPALFWARRRYGSGIGSSVLGGVNQICIASNACSKLRWRSIWGATLSTNCLELWLCSMPLLGGTQGGYQW